MGERLVKVLIVEDEERLAEFVRKGLRENGCTVDVAHDGEQGETLALTGAYDVIVLDIMLPGQSGFEVVRKIRAADVAVPVLFLSARDKLDDRVAGLELGADDYLVKPFAFAELLARLRALGRRSGAIAPAELTCADLVMSPVDRRVTRAGEVVTRTAIIEKVWDMNFYSFTNVVEVLVNRLRKKVDEPFPDRPIHTVRGVGYALRPPED